MTTSNADKVLSYEKFLNETLREDLREVLEARDGIYKLISDYLQLKTVIERLQESSMCEDVFKTRVNLGCNFYVQTQVPDCSKVCVAVGYGFSVEFTLTEAVKFIEKKAGRLTERVDMLTKYSVKIIANIKLVLEGLREIQNSPSENVKQFRDIF